jgi:hypothetical protein
MPLDATRPEFRELAPWPPDLRFLNGPVERIIQNLLPPRPDACSYTGSTAPPWRPMPSSPNAAAAISRRSAERGMPRGSGANGTKLTVPDKLSSDEFSLSPGGDEHEGEHASDRRKAPENLHQRQARSAVSLPKSHQ